MPNHTQNKCDVDQGELKFETAFKYTDENSDDDSTNNLNKICDINPVFTNEFRKRDHENQQSIEK